MAEALQRRLNQLTISRALSREMRTFSYRMRWRLRRSTCIGGIATDYGATARAARSTPGAPRTLEANGGADAAELTESSKHDATPSRSTLSVAVRRFASLEDDRLATPAPAVGRNAFALATRQRTPPEAPHARRNSLSLSRIASNASSIQPPEAATAAVRA